MVANVQQTFPWYEEVNPPDHPEKVIHVHNHWRRVPRKRVSPPKRETGLHPRITLTSPKAV